jgi:exonuclease VII large subunit
MVAKTSDSPRAKVPSGAARTTKAVEKAAMPKEIESTTTDIETTSKEVASDEKSTIQKNTFGLPIECPRVAYQTEIEELKALNFRLKKQLEALKQLATGSSLDVGNLGSGNTDCVKVAGL